MKDDVVMLNELRLEDMKRWQAVPTPVSVSTHSEWQSWIIGRDLCGLIFPQRPTLFSAKMAGIFKVPLFFRYHSAKRLVGFIFCGTLQLPYSFLYAFSSSYIIK
jgi:hypothetical protein